MIEQEYWLTKLVDELKLWNKHSSTPKCTLEVLIGFKVILIKARQAWEGSDRNVVCPAFWSIVMTEMAYRNVCISMSSHNYIQFNWQTERWDLWSHLEMAKMEKTVVCYKVPM